MLGQTSIIGRNMKKLQVIHLVELLKKWRKQIQGHYGIYTIITGDDAPVHCNYEKKHEGSRKISKDVMMQALQLCQSEELSWPDIS